MNDMYLPIEFTYRINIHPSHLNKKLHEFIKTTIYKELNNTCLPDHGHLKPGTIRIISKTLGKIEGSHLTGSVTYDVKVRCLATKPVKGTKIICTVIGKNEAGIMARNFVAPFIFFISRDGSTDTTVIDSLQLDSTIEVTVRDYKLVAPNKDRASPEYLIIADITAINIDSNRLTGLQHIANMTTLDWTVATMEADATVDGNTDLSDRLYGALMDKKQEIHVVNQLYNQRLSESDKDFLLDVKIEALRKRNYNVFVVGELVDTTPVVKGNTRHTFNVIRAFDDKYVKGRTHTHVIDSIYTAYAGDIVIYATNTKGDINGFSYDFWSNHVRVVINEYELIHPSLDYIGQIKSVSKFRLSSDSKISRAYYKMNEIIRNGAFNSIITSPNSIRVLNLAEAPGGFIQAIIDFRATFVADATDDIVAASINPHDGGKTWPTYERSLIGYISQNVNVSVLDDGGFKQISTDHKTNVHLMDGDLYQETVRMQIYNGDDYHDGYTDPERKADFITGDGGIHSERDEDQELINQKLLFAQAVTAMMCQKEGGTFVLKCFDIAHEFTANIVAILCAMYTSINIYKPKSSRPANSEKYIICQGYKANPDILDRVIGILNDWTQDNKIDQVFKTPEDLRVALKHFNATYMQKQIVFIESGLEYASGYLQNMGNEELMRGKITIQEARRESFFG
jgi:23S rRNA U2552 (ribose-2'-O)-methylase RlmE/FtsJ/DNA-directed RNA polymerase subunit E'/Rpb7